MRKVTAIFGLLLMSSTVFAGEIGAECTARLRQNQATLEASAETLAGFYQISTINGSGTISQKEFLNLKYLIRGLQFVKDQLPTSPAQNEILTNICELKSFDVDSVASVIEVSLESEIGK